MSCVSSWRSSAAWKAWLDSAAWKAWLERACRKAWFDSACTTPGFLNNTSSPAQPLTIQARAQVLMLVLDRTGSMLAAMPALKNATLRFIDSFREDDSFALYAFIQVIESLGITHREERAA